MNSEKTRVLIVGDKSVANTGFAIYKKGLLKKLNQIDKFEVAEYAFAGYTSEKKQVPWKYYPCGAANNEPDYQQFVKNINQNKNGQWRWEETVLHFKPHVVLCVQDIWMSSYIGYSVLKEFYNIYASVPVDSHPQPQRYTKMYNAMDVLVPYTNYAKKCLEDINLDPIDPIGVGVDENTFCPKNKERCREQIGLPKHATIFGFVARNQPRKRIPELLTTFRKYLDVSGKEDAYLVLHTTYPESIGWNLPQHLLDLQLTNKVFFTYICQNTKQGFLSLYKDIACHSPYTGQLNGIMNNAQFCVDEEYMSTLYNSLDLYIQSANCEGFGIPIIEAAACNIPVVSIDHSAMGEVTQECGGTVVKPASEEYCMDVKTKRAIIPQVAILNKMLNYKELPRRTRDNVVKKYSWDVIIDKWVDLLSNTDLTNKLPWNYPKRDINKLELSGNFTPVQFLQKITESLPSCIHTDSLSEIENLVKSTMSGNQQVTQNYVQNLVKRYDGGCNYFNNIENLRVSNSLEEKYWMK